jgi:glycerophosphoryl diester phosphodiesterase
MQHAHAHAHIQTLNRTTNGTGDVVDFTVAELKQFSAGYPKVFGDKYPDYRIPTFREALELLLNSSNTIMVLDLKVEHLGQHIASDIAYVSMCVSCVACAACAACRVMSRVSC